jgi:lambda repressor-like predicted transcriptional regulator
MTRRFPTAPAAALLRRRCAEHDISLVELADRVGLPLRMVRRCLEGRWLRVGTADRVACALGRHPGDLWPEWFA